MQVLSQVNLRNEVWQIFFLEVSMHLKVQSPFVEPNFPLNVDVLFLLKKLISRCHRRRYYIVDTSNALAVLPPKPSILGRNAPFDWTQFYKMLPHANIYLSKAKESLFGDENNWKQAPVSDRQVVYFKG